MKNLVVYYSSTGSNRYLAEKFSHVLKCDSEAILPKLNVFPLLLIFSLIKRGLGLKPLKHSIREYDRIILCGPIWMGQFISPLRDFINKYGNDVKTLHFATCCGSSDVAKADKFGYATVFPQIKRLLGDKCVSCEAFPICMVLPDDKQKDNNAIMKTRLSDNNFTGRIQERFESFVRKMSAA